MIDIPRIAAVCRRGVTTALIGLLLGLSACSGDNGPHQEPTPMPTATPSSSSAWVDPLQPDRRMEYQQLAVTNLPVLSGPANAALTSRPWHFLSLSSDARTLSLVYLGSDGCNVPVGFRVNLQGQQLVVESLSRPTAAQACADLRIGRANLHLPVALVSPIRLVHAAIDPNDAGHYFD